MTKYFSKDTPLASLERMMMSVPGFQKRGGGMMVLCRFHYKKEDVDCAYCQSYMRHTCQASVCPYIPERLEAGTVSYQELAEGCLHMAGHQKLWNRLSSLPKGKSLPLVLEPAHRRRLSEWLEAGIATSCPHELAAAYLLSSRAGLWRRVLPHISHGRIDFSSISLRGIDPRDYPVYRAAKGLYCGTLLITSSELADEEQVSSEAFGDILNASQLQELRERELRSNRKISDIDNEIARISEQNLVLVRLKSKGYVDSALYLSQMDEIDRKLRELRKLRRRLLEAAGEDRQIHDTERMMEYLEDGPEWLDEVPSDLFGELLDRIIIISPERLKFRLLNGMELSENIERMVR